MNRNNVSQDYFRLRIFNFLKIFSNSLKKSSNLHSTAAGRTTMTTCHPGEIFGKCWRIIAFICRLMRFRTTARLLTLRLIEIPKDDTATAGSSTLRPIALRPWREGVTPLIWLTAIGPVIGTAAPRGKGVVSVVGTDCIADFSTGLGSREALLFSLKALTARWLEAARTPRRWTRAKSRAEPSRFCLGNATNKPLEDRPANSTYNICPKNKKATISK